MENKFEISPVSSAPVQDNVWSHAAAEAYQGNTAGPRVDSVACYGTFSSPPPDAAFRLNPPQIGINGGMVVFNQKCDDERIKSLPNFKPDKV